MFLDKSLIVSCQALEDEPLHSSFIMGRLALAAVEGGATGIRANSISDIEEIKSQVKVPIIGIIKKDYSDSKVYITPTLTEVDALVSSGVDVIATDATSSLRPKGQSLEEFYTMIKEKYPNIKLMADCSTVDEAIQADKIGFDFIGTTLIGYTEQSKNLIVEKNDFEIIRKIINKVQTPVIAEGNIDTPEKAQRVLELGCCNVVVGSMITRPQKITEKFVQKIKDKGDILK